MSDSYDDESEDYGCKHTMSNCNCYEQDSDPVDRSKCWYCGDYNPEHPYRIPKIHGGWIGYFCDWKCAEDCNEEGGGNSDGRQCYINIYKQEKKYWTLNHSGY